MMACVVRICGWKWPARMLSCVGATLRAVIYLCATLAALAVVSTYTLQGHAEELAEDDEAMWNCPNCAAHFDSIPTACLTWFVLAFTGGLWETLAIPLLHKCLWSCALFIVGFFALNLAALNLLFVFLSRFIGFRTCDEWQINQRRNELNNAKDRLLALEDTLGAVEGRFITFEDITRCFNGASELANTLWGMEVCRRDLSIAFSLVDDSRSGAVSWPKFVKTLHAMKKDELYVSPVSMRRCAEAVGTNIGMELNEHMRTTQKQLLDRMQLQEAVIKQIWLGVFKAAVEGGKPPEAAPSEGKRESETSEGATPTKTSAYSFLRNLIGDAGANAGKPDKLGPLSEQSPILSARGQLGNPDSPLRSELADLDLDCQPATARGKMLLQC